MFFWFLVKLTVFETLNIFNGRHFEKKNIQNGIFIFDTLIKRNEQNAYSKSELNIFSSKVIMFFEKNPKNNKQNGGFLDIRAFSE